MFLKNMQSARFVFFRKRKYGGKGGTDRNGVKRYFGVMTNVISAFISRKKL